MRTLSPIYLFIALLVMGCSDAENQSSENPSEINTNNKPRTDLKENEMKVLTLPTPVQLASILKAYNLTYNRDLLTPLNNTKVYSSNYSRAICGGIYSVDLGYSTMFSDPKSSFDYFNHLNNILMDMGIKTYAESELNSRFRSNMEKPDSLSRIILETYDSAHRFLIANEQEKVGYYIIAGSYLEGLNIVCNSFSNGQFTNRNNLYNNLMCQHKVFLDNLLEISSYFPDSSEDKELQKILSEINSTFDKYNIVVKGNNFEIDSMLTSTDLKLIKQKIESFKHVVVS